MKIFKSEMSKNIKIKKIKKILKKYKIIDIFN